MAQGKFCARVACVLFSWVPSQMSVFFFVSDCVTSGGWGGGRLLCRSGINNAQDCADRWTWVESDRSLMALRRELISVALRGLVPKKNYGAGGVIDWQ